MDNKSRKPSGIPLVIDLVGKSGAGKTYVKQMLMEELSGRHTCVDISDERVSAIDYLDFILTSPGAFAASIMLVAGHVPVTFRKTLKLMRKWMGTQVRLKKAVSLECDFVLNDEGLFIWLQWIRGGTLRNFSFRTLSRAAKESFYYPGLTLFVTADFGLSEERRIARDTGKKRHRNKKLEKKEEKVLSVFLNNLGEDLAAAHEEGFFRVIRYNNTGNFDRSLIDKILAFKEVRGPCLRDGNF